MDAFPLVNLVSDPNGLLKLEKYISSFNFFEATGAMRRELRHSDFLGFLFDPNASHGLDDKFYRAFCTEADMTLRHKPAVTVSREWENIDILVRDRVNKTVLVIENKIDSSEHSNQLQRYRNIIERTYPDYDRKYFYLTRTGEEPSDDQWSILSYAQIRSIIKDLASKSHSGDVMTVLTHYADLIERHFMPNNEIAELCRKIYSEHRKAIDLIIEHLPESGEDIMDKIRDLIEADDRFEIDDLDRATVHRIRFAVRSWEKLPGMNTSIGWTGTGRILLFEIQHALNGGQAAYLKLYLGPTTHDTRRELLAYTREQSDVFKSGKAGEKWAQLFSVELLSSDDTMLPDRLHILEGNWNRFIDDQFPRINGVIQSFIER